MYVIAGLGNPGKEYDKTRHNMGFMVIDRICEEYSIPLSKKKHSALTGKGTICERQVMLVKPQTYMNESGRSIGEIFRYYSVDPEKLIVIYDDMDLEPGAIRIRKKGSAGSHNGMRSIISHMNTNEFPRIRVGIGKPPVADWKDYVLGKIRADETKVVDDGIELAVKAVASVIGDGIDRAMNTYNTRKKDVDNGEG